MTKSEISLFAQNRRSPRPPVIFLSLSVISYGEPTWPDELPYPENCWKHHFHKLFRLYKPSAGSDYCIRDHGATLRMLHRYTLCDLCHLCFIQAGITMHTAVGKVAVHTVDLGQILGTADRAYIHLKFLMTTVIAVSK